MSVRFIKWLIVVLIAAAIVMTLERLLRPGASAATPPSAPAEPYQNADMPATPTAPASQADSRSPDSIPPSA